MIEAHCLLPAQMLQDSVGLAEVSNNIPAWTCPDYFDTLRKTVSLFSFLSFQCACNVHAYSNFNLFNNAKRSDKG